MVYGILTDSTAVVSAALQVASSRRRVRVRGGDALDRVGALLES